MSLPSFDPFAGLDGFPRVSGDEPLGDITQIDWATFSPRERG